MKKVKIAGLWSGHDSSYVIVENGVPIVHDEAERFTRIKEDKIDSIDFMLNHVTKKEFNEIDYFTSVYPKRHIEEYPESLNKIPKPIHYISHHLAHAANAFYTSPYKESLILTLDGGGIEDDCGTQTACTIWKGIDNKIEHIKTFPINQINIGAVWSRSLRYIFKMSAGMPLGNSSGQIMALATLGKPDKYYNNFYKMLTSDIMQACAKPPGAKNGVSNFDNDPIHPYLEPLAKIARENPDEKKHIAAALQKASEDIINVLVKITLESEPNIKNLCMSGGVSLNCVATGKLLDKFPLKNIFIPPTPSDNGLSTGSAQYHYFHVLNNDRVYDDAIRNPYLGKTYSSKEILDTLKGNEEKIVTESADVSDIVNLLDKQNIIAVFNEGSESGRRSLMNRSCLADPRDEKMRDRVNKVKFRKLYRPSCPSVLREEVKNWFEKDIDCQYMSIAIKAKEEMKSKIPAAVHIDGTARLQTVTQKDNKWGYDLLKEWNKKTGVPMLLNTSLNYREPICETPQNALTCFLKTELDYLYFVQEKILVRKKK